jgi:hypothetical protein
MTSAYSMGVLASTRRNLGPAPLVKLWMHMDGTPGTQTYTDSSPYNRTIAGNADALLSTAQVFTGATSLHVSGPVNLTVPYDGALGVDEWARMGTDAHPLTAEIALNPDSPVHGRFLLGMGNAPRQTGYWWGLRIVTATSVSLDEGLDTDTVVNLLSPLLPGVWQSLTFQVRGTANREVGVWLDGVWQGSAVSTATPVIVSTGSTDDRSLDITRQGATNQFTGYLDEIKITEGLAYTWGVDYTAIKVPVPLLIDTFTSGSMATGRVPDFGFTTWTVTNDPNSVFGITGGTLVNTANGFGAPEYVATTVHALPSATLQWEFYCQMTFPLAHDLWKDGTAYTPLVQAWVLNAAETELACVELAYRSGDFPGTDNRIKFRTEPDTGSNNPDVLMTYPTTGTSQRLAISCNGVTTTLSFQVLDGAWTTVASTTMGPLAASKVRIGIAGGFGIDNAGGGRENPFHIDRVDFTRL